MMVGRSDDPAFRRLEDCANQKEPVHLDTVFARKSCDRLSQGA